MNAYADGLRRAVWYGKVARLGGRRRDENPYSRWDFQKSWFDGFDAPVRCQAGRDGDCSWKLCPQNDPRTRQSHCALDIEDVKP